MSTQVKSRMLVFMDEEPTVVIWHSRTSYPTRNVLFIYSKTPYKSRIPSNFGYLTRYTNHDPANVTFRNTLKEIYPSTTDRHLEHLYMSLRGKFQGRHCNPNDKYYSPDEFLNSKNVFEAPLERQREILAAILEGNDNLIIPRMSVYNGDLL